jgi:hypothetical protein
MAHSPFSGLSWFFPLRCRIKSFIFQYFALRSPQTYIVSGIATESREGTARRTRDW